VTPVEPKIPTRMGDGFMVEMTRSELRADIEAATAEAARKAKCPPLVAGGDPMAAPPTCSIAQDDVQLGMSARPPGRIPPRA
jgi:hypothetical protein